MTRTKNFLYCFTFLIIGLVSNAHQLDSIYLENKTQAISNDSLFISLNVSKKESIDSTHTKTSSKYVSYMKKGDSTVYVYPSFPKDYRRLGYNTGIFFGATIISFGVLWIMPESATNWDKADIKENGFFYKWKQNVKAGPVIDGDSFFINYITHPYSGAVYFMTARSSGFTFIQSFAYSAIMSTFFWEYGVESFAEIPSIQDLISTPIIGSAIGEGFFYCKKKILKNNKKVLNSRFLGGTTLFLIDPFNSILDGFGYKQKVKTQMNITPVGFSSSNKPVWGIDFTASF